MQAQKNDQRQLIIMKAMEYVKNGTYEALSIRDFCATAGITTGGFYRNFTSKESLFRYCYSTLLEEIVSNVDVLLAGLPLEEQLVRYSLLLLKVSRDTGERSIFWDRNNPETKFTHEKCHDIASAKLIDFLQKAANNQTIDPSDIPFMIDCFFVIMEGVYNYTRRLGSESSPTEKEEALIRHLMPSVLRH